MAKLHKTANNAVVMYRKSTTRKRTINGTTGLTRDPEAENEEAGGAMNAEINYKTEKYTIHENSIFAKRCAITEIKKRVEYHAIKHNFDCNKVANGVYHADIPLVIEGIVSTT